MWQFGDVREGLRQKMSLIFKICDEAEWEALARTGRFAGSPDDLRDGFIHLSDASQVRATAARHFAGRAGLMLLAVDAGRLGAELGWERSRGGARFPHLHGTLVREAVVWAMPLLLTANGEHLFPEEVAL